MTNSQYSNRQEQSGFLLQKILWIAVQWDNRSLHEELEDLAESGSFPFGTEFDYSLNGEDMAYRLCNEGKLGYIAHYYLPEHYAFTVRDGKPVGWCVTASICEEKWAYSNTIAGLVKQMEEAAMVKHQQDFQRWLEREEKEVQP